jgi:GMP synthase-like glutamine amidotransferase
VHQFVLRVTRHFPHKKLCGICWGHQTISRIFGGEVVDMDYPEVQFYRGVRVEPTKLTYHNSSG